MSCQDARRRGIGLLMKLLGPHVLLSTEARWRRAQKRPIRAQPRRCLGSRQAVQGLKIQRRH